MIGRGRYRSAMPMDQSPRRRRHCGHRRSPAAQCLRDAREIRPPEPPPTGDVSASTSAPCSASCAVSHQRSAIALADEAACVRHCRRVVTCTRAPAAHSRPSSTRLGASRMSSVSGLKARPTRRWSCPRCGLRSGASSGRTAGSSARGSWPRPPRDAKRMAVAVGRVPQRPHILREARAAIARARLQKVGPDAPVSADAAPHHLDVGARMLGQAGHLVHEADAGGEHWRWPRTW